MHINKIQIHISWDWTVLHVQEEIYGLSTDKLKMS